MHTDRHSTALGRAGTQRAIEAEESRQAIATCGPDIASRDSPVHGMVVSHGDTTVKIRRTPPEHARQGALKPRGLALG